jgi:uncharacterized protein YcbX
MTVIGTVKEIWRYPVKSMRGERLDQCMISGKGLTGDRGWTVRDDTVKEIRSGRTMPGLLDCTAEYLTEPRGEPYPAAMITLPDGTQLASDSGEIHGRLSELVGKSVSVWPIQPPEDTEHYRRLPVDEESLRKEFAREPGEPIPDLNQFPDILMKYVSVPGTYFDVTPVQLLTTSSLAFLRSRNPEADWSTLRFRPNIVIDTGEAPELIENTWLGRNIRLGEAELACDAPSPRCAITIHSQGDLIARDPSILRTIVREADQNLGLYCNVRTTGAIRIGDEVTLSA